MITNKTIKSKYQPKQTNVTWVDLNGKTPVEKHFINGKWREISGGGAGSSNPTEADATKVWQVTPVLKETKTEEFIVVPTQTIEANDYSSQILDNTKDINKVREGANAVITLDGVTYTEQVLKNEDELYISIDNGEKGVLGLYTEKGELFLDYSPSELGEHTISVSIIEETPIYDYNWAPGVKIPIPTAEDEGKILVVTENVSNTSIIVPEQSVPADTETPLTDVDLTKFVVGNTVKVTVTHEEQEDEGGKRKGPLNGAKSANSETFTETGVIEKDKEDHIFVSFSNSGDFDIWQDDNSLYTGATYVFGSDVTIKLEYVEPSYEYQLQENSGGGSNILYCEGSNDGNGQITAYIDSSELENPQITTIAVNTGENTSYFYRMVDDSWLVSGFNTYSDPTQWIKEWNTGGQYPTIYAYCIGR